MRLVDDVRKLLETYELNTFHVVKKSGDLIDGRLQADVQGIHVGDETPFGKIVSLNWFIECERPITQTPLCVKVYDYVSDDWIERTWEDQIRPIVRRYAPIGVEECTEDVESHEDRVYLSHRPIVDVRCAGLSRVDAEQGILFGSFPKRFQVTYTYGGEFEDVHRACVLLTASFTLGFIGSSTGGGSISVQGYGRSFGARGKYHDIRQDLDRAAYELLQKYVVGMV